MEEMTEEQIIQQIRERIKDSYIEQKTPHEVMVLLQNDYDDEMVHKAFESFKDNSAGEIKAILGKARLKRMRKNANPNDKAEKASIRLFELATVEDRTAEEAWKQMLDEGFSKNEILDGALDLASSLREINKNMKEMLDDEE